MVQTPSVNKVNPSRLAQNRQQVPVCRVSVYGTPASVQSQDDYRKAVRPPLHWCGVNPPGSEAPDAVFGRNGVIRDPATGKTSPNPWAVLSARVNITRQWNCSSASFELAAKVDNTGSVQLPPVRPNDVIVIEQGYVPSVQSRVGDASGRTLYAVNKTGVFDGDVVFFGVVDTVKERGGQGGRDGIVFTVLARDMMRFLADNKIRSVYDPKSQGTVDRALIVRDFIYIGTAVDYVQWQTADVGGTSGTGPSGQNLWLMREPKQDPSKPNFLLNADFGPGNTYVRLGLLEKSSRSDQIAPDKGASVQGIRVMDKFPVEVIKHFSMVESTPRELYADPQDGTINWLTRRTNGLRLFSADPNLQAQRQYFYRYPPDRANILTYTNEWSTIGTINHFILTNPLSNTDGTKQTKDLYAESPYALLKDPHVANGYLRPMTRNRFIYDDSLTQNDSAQAIVGSLFNIYGRALETGMVMVPGDPSLAIGEAVQLFNTGLFGRRSLQGQTDTQGGSAQARASDGTFADEDGNPPGVYRVEAVSHLFCVGGVDRGFVTVFAFGPADPDVGVIYTTASSEQQDLANIDAINTANQAVVTSRLIRTQEDMQAIIQNCLSVEQLEDVANITADSAEPGSAQAQDDAGIEATRALIRKKYGV